MNIETREVLADAYKGAPKEMLSHSCEVSTNGAVKRVLCATVRPDSMADRYAQDTEIAPTCPRCAAIMRRFYEK